MEHPVMGFENLHRHSDFSLLDGLAKVAEYADYSKEANQQFLCISDHGVMGAVPQQIALADKHKLRPIFACELYICPLQPKVDNRYESADIRKSLDPGTQKTFDKSNHLLAIAYNFKGYQNLVRLTSWAWIHGYYRRPRINHEILQQHKEGLIFTSTCANSEIGQAYLRNHDDQEGFDMIQKYLDMLGRDHFYLEMMMLDYKEQKPYDSFLQRAAIRFGLPMIMTCDCHFCRKEHSHFQHLMLMQQKNRTLQDIEILLASGDDDIFELQDTNLWMKSEPELNEMWEREYRDVIDYEMFKAAKSNTVEICKQCVGVELDRSIKLPELPDAARLLKEQIMKGFEERRLPKTQLYLDRIREEYSMICRKGFASYFLITQQITNAGRDICPSILGWGDGVEALGPGRGSVAGSLVAFCLHIHDVEPIKHDLLFSRFLSPSRGGKQTRLRFTIDPIS